MDVLQFIAIFKQTPELCSLFDYKTVQIYVKVIILLKPKLSIFVLSYQTGPPPTLPVNVHKFLKQDFSMSDNMGKVAWEYFCKLAWSLPFTNHEEEQAMVQKHLKLFLHHGISRNIGKYCFIYTFPQIVMYI